MNQILYYPYINLPRTDWTVRTLLYYENVGSIVPEEYFYNPKENYDPFMLNLVRSNLVIPINPVESISQPGRFANEFLKYATNNRERFIKYSTTKYGRINQQKFPWASINQQKFQGEIFVELERMGLAERQGGNIYFVHQNVANHLMKFLATVVGKELQMLPTTDQITNRVFHASKRKATSKRRTLLENLIPFPEEIDINKIRKFKDKNRELLRFFKNQTEQLVLNENIIEGTEQFKLQLEEINFYKNEIAAKLNEKKFGRIFFGGIFGMIGSFQGIQEDNALSAFIGGFPGFASAVYGSLDYFRENDIRNDRGLQYIALIDKNLRTKTTAKIG